MSKKHIKYPQAAALKIAFLSAILFVLLISGCSKKYGEDEFRTAFGGKTRVEVKKVLGSPWNTHNDGADWVYREIVKNKDTEKFYTFTTISFSGDVARGVSND